MMVVPSWPEGVPYKPNLRQAQPATRSLPPRKTEMQAANIRQRALPGDNVGTASYPIRMTVEQFAIFEDWRKTVIGNGAGRFAMPVWLSTGFATKVCQFADPPRDQWAGAGKVDLFVSLRVYGL